MYAKAKLLVGKLRKEAGSIESTRIILKCLELAPQNLAYIHHSAIILADKNPAKSLKLVNQYLKSGENSIHRREHLLDLKRELTGN